MYLSGYSLQTPATHWSRQLHWQRNYPLEKPLASVILLLSDTGNSFDLIWYAGCIDSMCSSM